MNRNERLVEAQTATVDTDDLRRAISAFAHAAEVAAEALRVGDSGERDRGRTVITASTTGLASLAFALIPKERK